MKRSEIIAQYEAKGVAVVRLEPGRSPMNARALLRGAATAIGAKVRTRYSEHQQNQGVTQVIGELVHGPVDQRGCWLCRQTAGRMARTMWLYEFEYPATSCMGRLSRILNDDPEDWQTEPYAEHLVNAEAAQWLALRKGAA